MCASTRGLPSVSPKRGTLKKGAMSKDTPVSLTWQFPWRPPVHSAPVICWETGKEMGNLWFFQTFILNPVWRFGRHSHYL